MIRLTDEEIEVAYADGLEHGAPFTKIAEAQLKKFAEWLEENTVSAYGGNRIILSEVWDIIQGVKND